MNAILNDEKVMLDRLFKTYNRGLVKLAYRYVMNQSIAEEVAQETWLGVLMGLKSFEGRSSLKTWIISILMNRAKTRAVREARSTPFSSLSDHASFDQDSLTASSSGTPEQFLLSKESRYRVRTAMNELSPTYRAVLVLRDIQGFSAEEACHLLTVRDGNQRVLLHRARARLRAALESSQEENSLRYRISPTQEKS